MTEQIAFLMGHRYKLIANAVCDPWNPGRGRAISKPMIIYDQAQA